MLLKSPHFKYTAYELFIVGDIATCSWFLRVTLSCHHCCAVCAIDCHSHGSCFRKLDRPLPHKSYHRNTLQEALSSICASRSYPSRTDTFVPRSGIRPISWQDRTIRWPLFPDVKLVGIGVLKVCNAVLLLTGLITRLAIGTARMRPSKEIASRVRNPVINGY